MKKKHLSTISVATILGTSFVLGMATSSHADAIAVAKPNSMSNYPVGRPEFRRYRCCNSQWHRWL
ncbi:MAG: hypothetical protein L3J50_02135 [Emcibacter sp.]|nr:hypothetical protein [Emcibacter sp.]